MMGDLCPSDIVEAGFEVSTSWGPSLSDQIAVSLQLTSENVCAVREASVDGKCVIAARGLGFKIEEGHVSLTRAQVLSADHNRQFIVGLTKGTQRGFAVFADTAQAYPPRRNKRSWRSSSSLAREMQGDYFGKYFAVDALDGDEVIVAAKGAFSSAIRFPDPRVKARADFDGIVRIFLLTDKGRILTGRVKVIRTDKSGDLDFETLEEEFEPITEKSNFKIIEPLGGDLLLAMSNEGALYFINGNQLQKLSAVPGEPVAMTGFAVRADYFDSASGSEPRWLIRAWVAARASEGGQAELYELKKAGHALEKTPYQPPSDESIVSLSADVKTGRVPSGAIFIPAKDYFAHPLDISASKVRAEGFTFEEKLIVGTAHHGTPVADRPPYALRGLTQGNALEKMEFTPVFRHRNKPKPQRKAGSRSPTVPQELLDPDQYTAFPRESVPDIEKYYPYLTAKAQLVSEYSDPAPLVLSLERRKMFFYQALKRRLMILAVYTDAKRGLRLSPMSSGLSIQAATLLAELATLAPGRMMRYYKPMSAAEMHPLYESWVVLMKTPLRYLYEDSSVPSGPSSKAGITSVAIRVTTKLAEQTAWHGLVDRLQVLYEEDHEVMSNVLIRLLGSQYAQSPQMQLGDAMVLALKQYDPLREFNSIQDIELAQGK